MRGLPATALVLILGLALVAEACGGNGDEEESLGLGGSPVSSPAAAEEASPMAPATPTPAAAVTPTLALPSSSPTAAFTTTATVTPEPTEPPRLEDIQGIWAVSAEGTGLRRLTSGNGDYPLGWLEDGRKLAFAHAEGKGGFDVYTLDMDSGDVQPLADTNGSYLEFSPDGSKVRFYRTHWDDDFHYEVYVLDLEHPTQVHKVADGFWAKWSPDGQRLAFLGPDVCVGTLNLHVVNADGSGLTQLTQTRPTSFDWFPDGSQLAVAVEDQEGSFGEPTIYLIKADGGWRELTKGHGPSVSPSGSHIAFRRREEGLDQARLYLMNADGTSIAALSHSGLLAWSPDGEHLAVYSPHRVFIVDSAAKDKATFGANHPSNLVWSPDRSRIAYMTGPYGSRSGDLVIARVDGSETITVGIDYWTYPTAPLWSPDSTRLVFELTLNFPRGVCD